MKISLNKLAEYNRSSRAARRKKIIKDAKFPFQSNRRWYSAIKGHVLNYVIDGDADHLLKAETAISKRTPISKTDFIALDNTASTRVIGALKNFNFPKLPKGAYYVKNNNKGLFLMKSGLKITAFPELFIFDKEDDLIGAMKLHYSKSPILEKESVIDIGHLIHEHVLLHFDKTDKVKRKYCFGADIPTGRVLAPTKAYKDREKDLFNSCENIVELWDSVKSS